MLDPDGGGADGDKRYTCYEASTWVTSNPHHISALPVPRRGTRGSGTSILQEDYGTLKSKDAAPSSILHLTNLSNFFNLGKG